ncbi:efflux RND transporter periplasmic adaptor subunit [Thiohalobacter thiocyanaticus]|uniref:Efflux RND transporter periplasmic adaptor subunit n=1 Tax=Thiohalobacter thiocyanaticus TaxID=585455 RepID=A0A426QIV6_9GAMM|nr:efflux RND transporter periplasmic adaptor subunit [Thiohalobacter thiocyanaticus]RRQ21702.1 efflux RND transporter periplasmic adaptor subunit [Thiohalobacter thiocyanaticus]
MRMRAGTGPWPARLLLVLALTGLGGCGQDREQAAGKDASPGGGDDKASRADSGGREILYWVAPMDPDYRRDEPGKSPMGMDLVPVYADEGGGGQVEIDPVVVQNLGVRTAEVERDRLWRRIDTVGYVDYDERFISHIHLRTDGWIDRLNVKSDGERVSQGQVLFELYSRELVNAQEEYLQALNSGNSGLKLASRERLQALGMTSAQIDTLARTHKVEQRVPYHARQDGIVDALHIREGMYVQPQTEVMTLADLSSVWIRVDVFERQADWVEVGQPVEVRLPYLPGEVWEGEIEFVHPRIDPETRTLEVRLRFDNPDERLKPDMYADVRIFAGPKEDILIIPREALIRTGENERVILALGEGRFAAQEVVSGIESGDWVEIMRGLEEGQRIVTSGQFLIDSESSIKGALNRLDAAGDPGQRDQPRMNANEHE